MQGNTLWQSENLLHYEPTGFSAMFLPLQTRWLQTAAQVQKGQAVITESHPQHATYVWSNTQLSIPVMKSYSAHRNKDENSLTPALILQVWSQFQLQPTWQISESRWWQVSSKTRPDCKVKQSIHQTRLHSCRAWSWDTFRQKAAGQPVAKRKKAVVIIYIPRGEPECYQCRAKLRKTRVCPEVGR